jgi:N-methylhydantoinase B/oxoprolinase/acetone carboxylase alpha subunit
MTYEENVQRIAEEMGKAIFRTAYSTAISDPLTKESLIRGAKVALNHMAEEVRITLSKMDWADRDIIYCLIKRGLIPAEEGGKV